MNRKILIGAILVATFSTAMASVYPLPAAKNDLVGLAQLVRVGLNNRVELSQKYDVGFYELVEANPGVDLERLSPSEKLLMPTAYLLPNASHRGVVINLAEMRMYFYPKGKQEVMTFPLGIGKPGWATPMGRTRITAKAANPHWRPTVAVRKDFLHKYGYPLPEVMMPGPDNPLGGYAMRLAWPSYMIHGTNDPTGVGKRISAGCIRMFDPDVAALFHGAHIGTPVQVVYQPYKAGWKGDTLYLEAHLPIPGRKGLSYKQVVKSAMKDRKGQVKVDWTKAKNVAKLDLGVPQVIGHVS